MLVWRRPARYLVVGAACAITHNLLMIAGDAVGLHYFPLTLLSFMLVTPLAFCLHLRFTFAETASVSRFFRFALGVAAAYPVALLSMFVLVSLLHLPMVLAAPIATVMMFCWNYVSASLAILGQFRPR